MKYGGIRYYESVGEELKVLWGAVEAKNLFWECSV
jgi:hypothetical protein